MSWKAPGRSFSLGSSTTMMVTGCHLDTYMIIRDRSMSSKQCTLTCPEEYQITHTVALQNCNGTGCCLVDVGFGARDQFQLQFVRHERNRSYQTSPLRDRIEVRGLDSYSIGLEWKIVDQANCVGAMQDKANYPCISKHSRCTDLYTGEGLGYQCNCDGGYEGNPYISDGCSRDSGYNPVQRKLNCSRWCGNISVPYPFGLEEGCFARKLFKLNCSNMTSSTLQLYDWLQVTDINIEKGLLNLTHSSYYPISRVFVQDEPELYVGSAGRSSVVEWAVANRTCHEAQQNRSSCACVSINSTCLGVYSENEYIGYHCGCMDGFHGNPYILHGCGDIDECQTKPGICKGFCHNTVGSYYCTDCPDKTEYDPIAMKCRPIKMQKIFLGLRSKTVVGIAIGLGTGLGTLLLIVSTIFLIYQWRKNMQKQQRRKYFQKNKGLILEQLISSDENASDQTKIFSLEELEKATNNFDPTRIVGRGGHGMVYKGILSDQRVTAIKKSKVIEQSEISQFINEVAILSQINHRNIVKLFGCCLETEVPLLVYDFIPNGSLFEVLHTDPSSSSLLSWDDCLRIATEAAGALYYLHSAASVSIFHRDVKSSNILLDGNYTAKMSDFGASRLVPIDQTHVTATNIQGTFGYLDPEYYHTGKLNEKSDVYSFGVVLVELLLRKEPIFNSETGIKQNLSNYFLSEMKKKPLAELVAAQVLEEATEDEINDVADLAEICLRLRGEERPTMKQVEITLQSVRSKRLKSNQTAPRSDDSFPLLAGQNQAICQSFAADISATGRTNLDCRINQNCYSLEQEFMESATLSR